MPSLKNKKELASQRTQQTMVDGQVPTEKEQRRQNSTYPKGGVSCFV